LGRFLEHSRIFHFANDGNDELYIGSADLMDRNLNRRVESLVLIEDKAHKAELIKIFDQYLDPTIVSWHLLQDGNWKLINRDNDGKALQDLHAKMIKLYKELV